ncbi:MAG: DUF2189 domain-containing protein, partial [Burkholderiaceae bacterium]
MNRSAFIDSLKALAAQVIVLHHFCQYAPMTDWLAPVWPTVVGVLHEDWRFAVQPLLVVGGFFAGLVFATMMVSIPMILDRDTDAITAGLTSLRVFYERTLVAVF